MAQDSLLMAWPTGSWPGQGARGCAEFSGYGNKPRAMLFHETWNIPNRLNDWFIANYSNHNAFFNTRFVTPPRRKRSEKQLFDSRKLDNLQFIKWTLDNKWIEFLFSRIVGWIKRYCKRKTCNLFSQSTKMQCRRVDIKAMMLLSKLFFRYAIFHWKNNVFHQNRAQTHRRVAFVAAPNPGHQPIGSWT